MLLLKMSFNILHWLLHVNLWTHPPISFPWLFLKDVSPYLGSQVNLWLASRLRFQKEVLIQLVEYRFMIFGHTQNVVGVNQNVNATAGPVGFLCWFKLDVVVGCAHCEIKIFGKHLCEKSSPGSRWTFEAIKCSDWQWYDFIRDSVHESESCPEF